MRKSCAYLLKSVLLVGLFIGCGADEEPPAPAVLQRVIPDDGSTVLAMGGIVLQFNKKPENFKIDPPLQFYFADEAPPEIQNYRNFSVYATPVDSSILILGPLATPVHVSVIEVSWGATLPQQSLRLSYFVQGPD